MNRQSALLAATANSGTPVFGAKYNNPATLPTGDGKGVAFSRTSNAIAVRNTHTAFITATA